MKTYSTSRLTHNTRDLLTLILAGVPSHVAHIALSCNASLGLEAS